MAPSLGNSWSEILTVKSSGSMVLCGTVAVAAEVLGAAVAVAVTPAEVEVWRGLGRQAATSRASQGAKANANVPMTSYGNRQRYLKNKPTPL